MQYNAIDFRAYDRGRIFIAMKIHEAGITVTKQWNSIPYLFVVLTNCYDICPQVSIEEFPKTSFCGPFRETTGWVAQFEAA